MTNHDLQLRAGGNSTKLIVKADGNVGIGTNSPVSRLHVQDSINGDAGLLASHVAVIENTSPGSNADILALKVGIGTAQDSNNFVTFFAGAAAIGAIEGNNVGGVFFKTFGADFAECLPCLHPDETIEAGDVVGVYGGKITKVTKDAQHIAAISGKPIIVGNAPAHPGDSLHHYVALVGQVSIKVCGPAHAGDFIVPSGLNDGFGRAVTAAELMAEPGLCALIVGRAWESVPGEGLHSVNTIVGLPSSVPTTVLLSILRKQKEER
jgi:hypothetical protein